MAEEIDDIDYTDNLFMRLLQCTLCGQNNRFNYEGFSYKILQTIEEGIYGRVYRCRHSATGDIVAIKQIKFDDEKIGVPSSVVREVSLLRALQHVNIVSLLKVLTKETYVNLVFEPLDQDLSHYIRDNRGVQDPSIRKSFLRQILVGVAYCHAHKILHRDLKPKNIWIDNSRMIIKIADFGLAREFGGDMLLTRYPPNRYYRAPEVFLHCQHYSSGIDLWSVGCIFGEMVIGRPILGDTCDELDAIFRMLGTPSEENWPGITQFPLFGSYAIYNPMDLSTVFSGLEPEGLELLKMLLCLDPKRRISAETALKHAYFKD
ncbi:hypothetical protein TanjilG_29793 [Lupinus angustifolius]|uniref:cyclin-dependent kinase n=1 Tax=Lupinus angustifolius TaxID=3871 RepID=A0A394DM88_LUPAN|nr:hypothetical protein TanjilG_29793 [Lupinus angustifolius]